MYETKGIVCGTWHHVDHAGAFFQALCSRSWCPLFDTALVDMHSCPIGKKLLQIQNQN